MKRILAWFLPVALGLLVVGGAGGWALSVLLTPPTTAEDENLYTLYAAQQGEVADSIGLNVTARWKSAHQAVGLANGTITTVNVADGDQVKPGTILYTVNLRPVTIATGAVPMFADIQRDDKGEQVSQLQQFLRDTGYYTGSVSGTFGPNTERAVKRWQKAIGVTADGIVGKADLVFVPKLPARIRLDKEIDTGKPIAEGTNILTTLKSAPTFELNIGQAQAGKIEDGADIAITSPDGDEWHAAAGEQTFLEDSEIVVVKLIAPEDDKKICLDQCGQVPANGETLLDSLITLVAPTEGVVVPTSALETSADGATQVIDEAGEPLPVTVLATAKGESAVSGIEPGTKVRILTARDE